jgi:TRAP-type C4-dicarboxylate transport system permease small subunit
MPYLNLMFEPPVKPIKLVFISSGWSLAVLNVTFFLTVFALFHVMFRPTRRPETGRTETGRTEP